MLPQPFHLAIIITLVTSKVESNKWKWKAIPSKFKVTHEPNNYMHTKKKNDVSVIIPKKGLGEFVGFQQQTKLSKTVSIFLGIPYASPPIGKNRFKLPQPVYLDSYRPWIAKSYSPRCLQWDYTFNVEFLKLTNKYKYFSEDCLYLNIFTPNTKGKLPVMAHIHGGSLLVGGARGYPGQILASHDIVVVTMNYRLNSFGLLSTEDWLQPGNIALWDQRMALEWVQNNIAWFGGDPESVTLSGESAGSSSVGLHVVSNTFSTRPLFHRVIMMSGSDTAEWAVSRPFVGEHIDSFELFANKLGCKQITSYDIIKCIQQKSASDIQYAGHPPQNTATTWQPVVDGVFLPNIPLVQRMNGQFRKVPILTGVTRNDLVDLVSLEYNRSFENYLNILLSIPNNDMITGPNNIVQQIKNLYLPKRKISPKELRKIKHEVMVDYDMAEPTYRVAYYHSMYNQSAYYYQFEYPPTEDNEGNIRHGKDLPFQWGYGFVDQKWWLDISDGINDTKPITFTQEALDVSKFIMTMWTNFIKTGNPTPQPVSSFTWPAAVYRGKDDFQVNCARLTVPKNTIVEPDFRKYYMQTWLKYRQLELQSVLKQRYNRATQQSNMSPILIIVATVILNVHNY